MVLRFNLDIDVIAGNWENEEEKKVFIKNFTDVVQQGLFKMTVSDWEVKNVTVKELEGDD